MAEDKPATQGAPSAPPMMAAAQPATEPAAKPKRGRKANGGAPKAIKRRGPAPLSAAEKAQRAAAREELDRQRREHVTGLARTASIGALMPNLLNPEEISALAKFTLAQLQQVPAQQPGEQSQ